MASDRGAPERTRSHMASSFDRSQIDWFRSAAPDRWHLPPNGWRRAGSLIGRSLTRRCPYCGARGVFRSYLSYREHCPSCGARIEREEGYFVGAYAVNIVGTLFLGLAIVVLAIILTDLSVVQMQVFGVAVAIALPLLGYPLGMALWVALDLFLDRPENTNWAEANRPDLVPAPGTTGPGTTGAEAAHRLARTRGT